MEPEAGRTQRADDDGTGTSGALADSGDADGGDGGSRDADTAHGGGTEGDHGDAQTISADAAADSHVEAERGRETLAPSAAAQPDDCADCALVRERETPIFAAMYSRWNGPAASLIGRSLHRADADTMVFDAVMWQPGPEHEPRALRFQVGGDRHAPVVTASGELTTASVGSLTTPLRHIMRRRPRQVIVDLSGITAATRSGLRALIETREAARAADVDFWLRSPSQPVQDLLHSASARASRGPAPREKHITAPTPGQPQPQPQPSSSSRVAARHDAKDAAHSAAIQTADEQAAEGGERRHAPRRHAADTTGHMLDGVVVEMQSNRTRQWWSSHSLRESLRRVGSINQHPQGHRTAT